MTEEQTMPQAPKSNTTPLLILAAVVILALVGVGLVKGRSKTTEPAVTPATESTTSAAPAMTDETESTTSTSPAAMTSPAASTKPGTSMTADSEVKIVEVEAGSFYYKPNEIRVKKGQKVRIVLKSVSMMHDFNVDELNVHSPITKNGETSQTEFTANKTGTFEYYCSVGQHRKLGQVGKLIVE